MALPCGPIVDQVGQRIRDPGFTANTRTLVRDLLSRLQAIINGATGAVVQSANLTVFPQQQVYSISGDISDSVLRVVDVRDPFGRSLDGPIPFENLKWLNMKWWRETGPELRSWLQFGDDVLILRPALSVQSTVMVFYEAATAPLVIDADTFQCPDEDVRLVSDAAEAILDIKQRELADVKPILERLMEQVKQTREQTR